MSYKIEDEVDWSDSPFGPPSPQAVEPLTSLSRLNPAADINSKESSVSAPYDHFAVADRSPFPFSMYVRIP
jgi:hypothetical protein